MNALKLLPSRRQFLTAIAALALFTAVAVSAQPAALDRNHPRVREVMAVQNAMTADLMKVEDVLGTATGTDEAGEIAVIIYVNQRGRNAAELNRALPGVIRGAKVRVELTDKFVAYARPGGGGGGGISHTARQTPPIQMGTSGGFGFDLANGYCCGGTLGCLITKNGVQYILSNYHVFESDIVSGGNNRIATTGDPVIQPALIDINCNLANSQTVATLVVSQALPTGNIDASIAQVVPGMVRADGSILGIGTISATPIGASIGQGVKKAGRTTGLTTSSISALNANVSITYENECAGGTAFTKTFSGQIVAKNKGSKFLNQGDSGSVMVQNVSSNPRPIGLLFAGGSTSAIANPIGDVLNFFGATIVGQ